MKKIFYIILIGLAVVLICTACGPTMKHEKWIEKTYVVKSDESLWSISGKYCPDSIDRREWISAVKKLNNMTDSTIYAGEKLIILEVVE